MSSYWVLELTPSGFRAGFNVFDFATGAASSPPRCGNRIRPEVLRGSQSAVCLPLLFLRVTVTTGKTRLEGSLLPTPLRLRTYRHEPTPA